MVENQCGLTDIVQSTTAKVTVRPNTSSPPAESAVIFCASAGSPVRSCSADHALRRSAMKHHTAK
jgi:hypothetical protein